MSEPMLYTIDGDDCPELDNIIERQCDTCQYFDGYGNYNELSVENADISIRKNNRKTLSKAKTVEFINEVVSATYS